MKDIIQALTHYKYTVTVVDGESVPVNFYLGVVFDDLTDLWYLGQLCTQEGLDVGIPLFKENVVYFPRLLIDAKTFELIIGEAQ